MQDKKNNNFAYIDGANLYEALKELKWSLDYKRFRVWLLEKYCVGRAYIFIGLISKYKNLYTYYRQQKILTKTILKKPLSSHAMAIMPVWLDF